MDNIYSLIGQVLSSPSCIFTTSSNTRRKWMTRMERERLRVLRTLFEEYKALRKSTQNRRYFLEHVGREVRKEAKKTTRSVDYMGELKILKKEILDVLKSYDLKK